MNLNRLGQAMEGYIIRYKVPHTNALHGLIVAEEAGEVARAVLKGEQGTRGTAEYWRAELEHELAGVVTAAAACADHYGIDLELAVARHLADIPTIFEKIREPRKPNGVT